MATDFFLKIEGIKGESTDAKHKEEIDVESWSWGESNAGGGAAGSGHGEGKVNMQDFHFTTKISKASPALLLHCANGAHLTKAELFCRKAGGKQEEYLHITFSDLVVSSFQTGGSSGGGVLTDQISLAFTKIEYEFSIQKADGTLAAPAKAGWNLKTNVKV